jgi:hypothetical protein
MILELAQDIINKNEEARAKLSAIWSLRSWIPAADLVFERWFFLRLEPHEV